MGVYSEYLDANLSVPQQTAERKRLLKAISAERGGRDILVFAGDPMKNASIEYPDILPIQDQLSNLHGTELDIILETPGGFAEVVEDLVRLIRAKYSSVAVIIPGYAKSAGTIFSMAADDILMGQISALGPIDAQIQTNGGKRFSADAFLDGLQKIKEEVVKTTRLNPAFIPILQNISPGEIQHCENAQSFSRTLVKNWLVEYKFKTWAVHSSTGLPVTIEEKTQKAEKIATCLCKHADWLTHSRSIKIADLRKMGLQIQDYSENSKLDDAITRYYTLLRMAFESTNIYKIFETPESQIYRFYLNGNPLIPGQMPTQNVMIDFNCPNCQKPSRIQANLEVHQDIQLGCIPYPVSDNIFICPHCGKKSNILQVKTQLEAQTGKKVVP